MTTSYVSCESNSTPCPFLTYPNNGVTNGTLGDNGVPSYEDTL